MFKTTKNMVFTYHFMLRQAISWIELSGFVPIPIVTTMAYGTLEAKDSRSHDLRINTMHNFG